MGGLILWHNMKKALQIFCLNNYFLVKYVNLFVFKINFSFKNKWKIEKWILCRILFFKLISKYLLKFVFYEKD